MGRKKKGPKKGGGAPGGGGASGPLEEARRLFKQADRAVRGRGPAPRCRRRPSPAPLDVDVAVNERHTRSSVGHQPAPLARFHSSTRG